MKYPELVPESVCRTPVVVILHANDVNKYGDPVAVYRIETGCNYQDRAQIVRTAEKEYARITGAALFPGDLAPELPIITGGSVTVFGIKRNIVQGIKARNPDGTVNYTELRLE